MQNNREEARTIGSSTQAVLRFCQEIEATCADIYTNYAVAFGADRALGKLWRKLADEELNHAHIIGMAMRCKGLGLRDKNYDMDKFRTQAKEIHEILQGLQETTSSASDALRSAIGLEKKLSEFHLDHVVEFVDPSEEKFFKLLFEGDKLHTRQLEEAYQSLEGN